MHSLKHVVYLHACMVQELGVYFFFLMPFDRCPLYTFWELTYNQNLPLTNLHIKGFLCITCQFIVLGILLFRKRWHLSVFTFICLSEKQFMRLLSISSSVFVIPFVLPLITKGVLSSAQPVTNLFLIIRNMSGMKIVNKSGPIIEPWCTPDIIFPHEL